MTSIVSKIVQIKRNLRDGSTEHISCDKSRACSCSCASYL